jgi:hypothetical protein
MKEAAMPELKMLKVVVGGRGQQGVRVGDQITLMNRREGVVESAVEKQSYEYYTLTSGEKGRLPLDNEVVVLRNVPTDEEEATEALARLANKARKLHDQAFKEMDRTVEVLAASYKTKRNGGHYRPFDLDAAASIARKQETCGIWAAVADNARKHSELKPDVRWLRAILAMRQYAREALCGRYRNSLSRSTSLTSNLQEDLRLDAYSEFLHETDYQPYNDMVAVFLPSFEIKEV